MSLEAVTLKLPTFWTTCPLAWFAQTEAQFSLRNISSDDTKYYYVVAALDANTAMRALSIISSPPAEQKYELLKSFLTSAFGLSEPQRANALLDLTGLGDRKPSELMDSMLTLLLFALRNVFLEFPPWNSWGIRCLRMDLVQHKPRLRSSKTSLNLQRSKAYKNF